jgi:hypothetical protein
MSSYKPPVSKLLTYGSCLDPDMGSTPDYVQELGFTDADIPELIRLVCDRDLSTGNSEKAETWAIVHAWRTLGQLKAEAAIAPLLSLFELCEEDEWMMSEMPEVFGSIGGQAISPLTEYMADTSHIEMARTLASESLAEIGMNYPELRSQCVAVLTKQLEQFEQNPINLNSLAISGLVELEALESAAVIEQAFASERVDLMFEGDWDEVQVSLGLKSRDQVPKKDFMPPELREFISLLDRTMAPKPFTPKLVNDKKGKSSSKNKMAKQSRQKNRKKK